jgi:hypothetical protein
MTADGSEDLARLELQEAVERVLAVTGEARLDAILDAPDPGLVVRSLAPVETFYTYATLDEEGRRALVRLVDDDQLDYLVDLDLWDGDRIDPEVALDWIERIWGADQDRAATWLHRAETSLVLALLGPLCTATMGPSAGEGEVLTEKSDDLPPFTAEGVYYLSFASERAAELLRGPLLLLASLDVEHYLALMTGLTTALDATVSEEAYEARWRRLRDEGWVPPEEAYEIYRWPTAAELAALEQTVLVGEPALLVDGAPRGAATAGLALVDPAGAMGEAFARLEPEARRRLAADVAALSGRVLSADHRHFAELDEHRRALAKTLGLVALGLHRVGRDTPAQAAETLGRGGAAALFRLGAAAVASLGRRALALRRRAWLGQVGLGLEVLGEPLASVVRALSRPRPVYPATALDGAAEDRDFRSAEDLDRCAELLGLAETLGRLFLDGLGLDLASAAGFDLAGCHPPTAAELTLDAIARTAVANALLGHGLRFRPVETGELADLVRRARDADEASLAADLTGLLADRLGAPRPDERRHLAEFVEQNVATLRSAVAGIDLSRPVDPRFVGAVVIRDGRR